MRVYNGNIEVGSNEPIIMFGPMIFADLRITADAKREAWVIERQVIEPDGWRSRWMEVCALPCQVDSDV